MNPTIPTSLPDNIYGELGFERCALRRYWLTGAGVVFGLLSVFLAIPSFGASLLLFPALLLLHWLWIKLVFMRLYYEVDEDSVNIREGVVIHIEKVIPLEKITDIKLIQGPLMRLFGVYNLMLQTAGSSSQLPEGMMTFESREKAEEVRERIMTARRLFRASPLGVGSGGE
jgi:membrane protein YdbS with pleckstrin-like domain